ncbi:MAG: WXG100 family type VII secretion target [Anaerolineae bacterium]|nr:WXG100 family type VII secretion target [Anaerolineae bacterium]
MATLRFDTDAGRMTAGTITTTCQNLQSEMTSLSNRINSMVGSEWIGNSANQFQSEFQTWSEQLRSCVTNLETLRQRLEREITEWEQAAATLS